MYILFLLILAAKRLLEDLDYVRKKLAFQRDQKTKNKYRSSRFHLVSSHYELIFVSLVVPLELAFRESWF